MLASPLASDQEDDDEEEEDAWWSGWYLPRQVLRRTNFRYRNDGLRPRDLQNANLLWEQAEYLLNECMEWVVCVYGLYTIVQEALRRQDLGAYQRFKEMFEYVYGVATFMYSEGTCVYMTYLETMYYPIANRLGEANPQLQFPPERYSTIDELNDVIAYDLTGFNKQQLHRLFLHLRIPQPLRTEDRRSFGGQRCFIIYLCYFRKGLTKVIMSYIFGGDPRYFTSMIRAVDDHLYGNFYHKISGDSLRMWLPCINSFREVLHHKATNTVRRETIGNRNNQQVIDHHMEIDFNTWRIFGFLDDTGMETNAPGGEMRRAAGVEHDIQRSFYSGYFAGHGLKAQVLLLANGMVGSVFIASLRNSDSGVLNMSGLNQYLCSLLDPFRHEFNITTNELPALYCDGIFPQLLTIVARHRNPTEEQAIIDGILAGIRQSVEHSFALHRNLFALFSQPAHHFLLRNGVRVYKSFMNSFLLFNCYQCINESSSEFGLRPPTLEQYLPLDEELTPAPEVTDQELGEVYRYYY